MSQNKAPAIEVQKKTEPARQLTPEATRQPEQGPVYQVAPQAAYRRAQFSRNGLRPADLLALQRSVGNRQVQRMVALRSGAADTRVTESTTTIQRDSISPVKSNAQSLTNLLFAGEAKLQAVLNGKKTFAAGKGTHIYKIQVALMNLGYGLPIYGADSLFTRGGETALALSEFQKDAGVPITSVLEAATMYALDKKAPATSITKYPEYGKLLGDGLLDFTIGVGYDESGQIDPEIEAQFGRLASPTAIVPGLVDKRKFVEKTVADAEKVYAKAGLKMPSTSGGRYFIKPAALKYKDKQIDVIVRLLTYKDPDAKKAFLEAMQKSDVTMYTGHGRYGSGPDFDVKSSGAGNILINPGQTVKDPGTSKMYSALKKQKVKQALQGLSFDQKYKIWFFDGCNTKHYMQSIRKFAKVDPKQTDVFGWGSEIRIDTSGADILSFLDGIIAMLSAKKLIEDLNRLNKLDKAPATKGAGAEGLGDNPETQ